MVSTFVNPVVNPAARLGVAPFDETAPLRLWPNASMADVEITIRAVYRQVLGNAHVMESERLTVAESQLKQGELSVREFVRQVARSEFYRQRFFENCPRNRAIELNFKHLLGRAPESYEEMVAHGQILDQGGHYAEIDSYLDSDEYQTAFGEDIVPYYRGHKTQTGKNMVGFTHMFQLLRGASSSDQDPQSSNRSRLNRSIMGNRSSAIKPFSLPPLMSPLMGENQLWAQGLNGSAPPSVPTAAQSNDVEATAPIRFYHHYKPFKEAVPVELCPGATADEREMVIRAVYKQVLGNAHVMESERLIVPESQFQGGELSVREFVRQLAKSALYRSRYFDSCYRYRAIELNFKHLLGRAPDNLDEMRYHSTVLDNGGHEAEIDSYLDSDEYQNTFGENIVPYYRGYQTQNGQSLLEFTNMLQLLRSASSSDKGMTATNEPLLTRALITNSPYGKYRASDASQILADLFSRVSSPAPATAQFISAVPVDLTPAVSEIDQQIAALQQQLTELRSTAAVGAAIVGNTYGSAAPIERPSFRAPSAADQVAELQAQVAEARALSSVADYRLNKWRSKSFR
jgi:Phycobilisome Linker polypeptide